VTVYLVGAGPGDPALLTRRAATLLAQADVVLYDRLVHPSVLALAPGTAELVDVGKTPGGTGGGRARQDEIDQLLIHYGQRSATVVRLKGGDPFVFGRGGEEVEVLVRAGVPWEVVPGISSAFAVPAVAGIPVTHRGLSSSVTVVTGRVDDPLDGVQWEALAKIDGTLVILMGMMDRAEIADALQRGGKSGATPTAVIERGTTPDQVVVRTTLDQLATVPLGSPAVIVVGPVAALGAHDPAAHGVQSAADGAQLDRPLAGRTVVVARAGPRAQGLLDALRRAGAEPLRVALTEQTEAADGGAALRAAVHELRSFTWVVFTSVNAVTRCMAAVRDARAFGSTLVAAVGPATAEALRRAGIEPDLVPAEHVAHQLVAGFPDYVPGASGNQVLFPCADIAPPTVPDGLRAKGWQVQRVVAYRTAALPPPEPAMSEHMARADAVIFTAASSVQAYAALRTSGGSRLPVPPVVICIGPTTSEAAKDLGMTGVVAARSTGTDDIVEALVLGLGAPDSAGAGGS
jgi:uroporphyrinogen III methyltransferase/synthase